MPNRLAQETSPYLLQHKDNPVDWYPWGDEAFEKAKREDKPVFLSVGYSSCHWCHVMEHESFEDQAVAEILNRSFVSIKVDREERPDIDEAYMTAVQLSSGRGGWPMSVFLTPDRKPFFAGTYFPKEDREGYPGFQTILVQIAAAWATKKEDLKRAGDEFAHALEETLTKAAPAGQAKLEFELLNNVVRAFASDFDPENGGTIGAPKFPPHTGLDFLMRYALQSDVPDELRQAAVGMALLTLEKISLGGIHDHVGGGFHRYSTDEKWILPHFEKMLYDNALMLGNLAKGAMIASQLDERLYGLFYRGMSGIVHWVLKDMTSPEGLFCSALDADTEGVEGKYYVWTVQEVRDLLGERADAFIKAFNLLPEGNFEDEATHEKTGANVLYLTDSTGLEFMEDLAKLSAAREKRIGPALDDKAIVAWNGLMISALVESGIAIGQAEAAAEAILNVEKDHGELPHQIAKGKASGTAFLDDYAYFAHSLLALTALHEEIESGRIKLKGELPKDMRSAKAWRQEAERLIGQMIERFYDHEHGGFFYTATNHEVLFGRTKQAFDQPMPSPNAIAIRCLLEIGDQERAQQSLESFLGWMERAPTATEALHIGAMDLLAMRSEAAAVVQVPSSVKPPTTQEPSILQVPSSPTVQAPAAMELNVRLEPKELRAGVDRSAEGKIVIEVPEGFHINSSEPPARWLTPTRVDVQPVSAEVQYPPARNDRYEGRVEIPFKVRLPENEQGADFEIKVSYQACTESECLLPQEKRLNGVVFIA
ncbi:MAG: uncharacterized protein QOJ65_2245 [Fimbriimonadaceae bacterium]|jgi:uncharacterized protein YyaL (SSP411 family)|nr:uncharacterized protein [Fimbriimonadaceae bacterium]